MAFGRLQRPGVSQPMSEINMTPLIDVMLVLLVIFIITAPLMSSSLRLDLPKTTGATPTDAPLFVTVAVDAQGRLFWGDEPVTAAHLGLQLRGGHRLVATRPPRCSCVPTRPCPSAALPS